MSTTDPSASSAALGQKNLSTIHAVAQSLAIGPMFSTALLLGLISNPVTGAGWNSALAVLLAGLGVLAIGYVVALYARRFAGAGAVYEYLTHGAHPWVGVLTAGIFFLGTLFLGGGGIYLGDVAGARHEFKRYDIQDGLGIYFLRSAGLIPVIVTGRVSMSVELRARELGIEHVVQDADAQKLVGLRRILDRLGLGMENVAHLGDDFPDLPIMQRVALPVSVANAVPEVRAVATVHLTRGGGRGAVRVFNPHPAVFHSADAPRRVAQENDVTGETFNSEVFVDRSDHRPVRLGNHGIVGRLGNGAAGGNRRQTGAAPAAHPPVDPIIMDVGVPATAAGGDAGRQHFHHIIKGRTV